MIIRPVREIELAAVGALTVAGYDDHGYLIRPDGSRDDDYAGQLGDAADRSRGAELIVAVEGDQLLGTVTWCPPGAAYRELSTSERQGEFRMLSVARTARNHGVGGALVDWCLAEARRTGLREVLLCSLPEMTSAHRLYTSRGFARRTELDWSPKDGVSLWAFSLDL